jgi:hypothetical protein
MRGSLYDNGDDAGLATLGSFDATIVGFSIFDGHACTATYGEGVYDVNLVDAGTVLLSAIVPSFTGVVQTAANEYGCYWPGENGALFAPWGGGAITTFGATPPTDQTFVRLAADATGLFSVFDDGHGDYPGDGGGPFYQLPDAGDLTGLACSSGIWLVSNDTSLAWISAPAGEVLMVSKH